MGAATKKYQAEDIEVLEGLEPVRKRPGMYIGGTDGPQGLHHLIKEIVDNSIDEAMNGHASLITVTLHRPGNSITIEDNGRGIPVDIHPKFKKTALEIIFTTLHAGGKFSDTNYSSAGGLHGVGASVVNALSESLEATVWRDGYTYVQKFSRGKPLGALKKGEKTKKKGTQVTFSPDPEIFKNTTFSSDRVKKLLQEKAFLNAGLKILFKDEVKGGNETFCYEDGVQAYVKHYLKEEDEKSITEEIFFLEKTDGIKISAAFVWTESTKEHILSYVNGIPTPEGGTHVDGFKSGLSKAIRNYANVHDSLPKGVKLSGEDIREGLLVILAINIPGSVTQLQFQGQTKDRLNNPEAEAPVENLLRTFENTLNSNPTLAQAIIERMVLASKARAAARSASQSISRKVSVSHRLNLPGKLADCSSTSPLHTELFIVEGDSAGGTAKQCRDRKTQAVLPLRGKVLNTIASSVGKATDNKELLDLASAIGCGVGDGFKIEKLRYGKIVILTDADADGMHIAALLMAFFFKFMKPLITNGNLFLGQPPLYRMKFGSGAKEETHWVYSDEEKEKLLKGARKGSTPQVTRFKGLGEMNPPTLWDTTLNPKTRNLLRVRIDDEKKVVSTFESLFGKDSSDRYQLITTYADRLEVDL